MIWLKKSVNEVDKAKGKQQDTIDQQQQPNNTTIEWTRQSQRKYTIRTGDKING